MGEETALGQSGRQYRFVRTDNPPSGSMKHTFFAPDRSYVVQFFNDPKTAESPEMKERLYRIIRDFNPTVPESMNGAPGNTEQTAAYFRERYCWPLDIVVSPEFGIVCPAYPKQFFFNSDASVSDKMKLGGKEKKSNWFTSRSRRHLRPEQLGDFRTMLSIAIRLARSVRRLHAAGLAHSDLSNNNVLIDPMTGDCIVIDIDSLVVPGVYPPEVAGTRGYIAPEILATMNLARDDPKRFLPRIESDLHSLPVLIYEYLFHRHPLDGPKRYKGTAEEEDFEIYGPHATFIEHPTDRSNRPDELDVTIDDLGPGLKQLFIRAFVDGVSNPRKRPAATEWEAELEKAWDLLQPCPNPRCQNKWFIMHDKANPVCPSCGTKLHKDDVMQLVLKKPSGHAGQWRTDRILNLYDGLRLYRWHMFSGQVRNEKAERDMQAHIVRSNGEWLLVNDSLTGMISPGGNLVPRGQAIRLSHGQTFCTSEKDFGRIINVL